MLDRDTEAENRTPETPPAQRQRILLVDDHELGRKSVARLLDSLGFEVTTAADGDSALKALVESPRFDYLLTDVRLPDLDGREIVHAARQLAPPPRIALITGWDIDPDEKARLGIDWIFLKPLDIQDIVSKLQPPG